MYSSRSRRPESDPYGAAPKRGRTSGFDSGGGVYSSLALPSRYEARDYATLGVLGVHEGRYDRDSGLLGVPDAHSLARGAYLMDARVAPGVLLPGAPHSNAGGAFLPFPPGPGRGVPADPLPPLPVVRLRGLPFQCSEEDVLEFFAGLEVLDVVLPRREGRATGDAWVLLASPPQCALALQRNRLTMGRRYVEVFQAQRQDYYKAIVQEMGARREGQPAAGTGRKPRGTPPSAGSGDKSGVPPGSAAKPSAPAPAPAAAEDVKVKDESQEGSGAPAPAPATAEGVQVKDESQEGSGAPRGDGNGAEGIPGKKSSVLRLRGLPYAATKRDVVDFFEGFNVAESRVHLLLKADGQSTGQGYVEFHSPAEAAAAMLKHGSKMGSRYVELFACTEQEAANCLDRVSA